MFLLILQRLFRFIPIAITVIIFVTALTYLVPGDPADQLLGEYATFEQKEALKEKLGLNRTFWQQIIAYFRAISSGDLGNSLIYHQPVLDLIIQHTPATLELTILSILVSILIGLPLGVLSALRKNSLLDYFTMAIALFGVAIPNFWLGPMLIITFSLTLGWLPVSGRESWLHYILPAITIGSALASILSRMTRNSILDHLHANHVYTARAKGLKGHLVILKHVLRNAATPLMTIISLQFGVLLTGAVITERIFDWPGLGYLTLEALNNRDYPVIQGCILIFALMYLIVNLVTDILYVIVDPRMSLDKKNDI